MSCIYLILSVLFLFSSSSSWSMGHLQASVLTTDSPLIGKAALDAVMSKTDGRTSHVLGTRRGEKTILVFWATWCPHCYEELGVINSNISSVAKKGVKIVLVDIGENRDDVQNYFNQRQFKLISFVDTDSYLQGLYHLEGVPTLVFIDEKGIVRSVTHAFPSDYEVYFGVK